MATNSNPEEFAGAACAEGETLCEQGWTNLRSTMASFSIVRDGHLCCFVPCMPALFEFTVLEVAIIVVLVGLVAALAVAVPVH